MAQRSDWRLLLPHQVRSLPFDLAVVLTFVAAVNLTVFLPIVQDTPLRVVFGLPFVLFVPGYAFIAALFPEQGTRPDETTDDETEITHEPDTGSGIDGIERVALSFGLSIAIVPLLGLVLNFTPFGIRLTPIMVTLSLFTVVATAVAATRRWALAPDERLQVPYRQWVASARSELFEPDDRTDVILNVVLVLSILLAAASVTYAVAVPKEGEQFTETYLLTETEDGDLIADNYPTEFTVGENRSLVVGISNHEHEPVEYTVVVQLQNVTFPTENTTQVTQVAEVGRFRTSLGHNETWHHPHSVTPTFAGDRLRLAYLVYKGEPPAEPSVESAYRSTHLWVNITAN